MSILTRQNFMNARPTARAIYLSFVILFIHDPRRTVVFLGVIFGRGWGQNQKQTTSVFHVETFGILIAKNRTFFCFSFCLSVVARG